MAGFKAKVGMFREVNVFSSTSLRWKSISICTGASASTLQDIKVPESCGGYSYIDSGVAGSNVRNRFIYWRTHQDVLELVEESLDTSLSGNMVQYRFQDTPVLPHVTIHETHGNVVILIATVASVHRLIFPHPKRLNRQSTYISDQNATSIFYNATLPDDPKNQFLLAPGGSITSHFLGSSSCVCLDGHAIFTLATNTGGILMVKMPPVGICGVVIQQELSCANLMKKLWNGLIPGALRGGSVTETVLSIQLVPIQDDIFIFSVCRDLKLRVWSIKTRDCLMVENLLDYTSEEFEDSSTPAVGNASGHVIKGVRGGGSTTLCVYLSLQHRAQFVFLSPEVDKNGRLQLKHLTTMERTPPDDLVDFVVTEDFLMSLWTSQAGETLILTTSLAQSDEVKGCDWHPVELSPSSDCVFVPQNRDAREVYLDSVFNPQLFAIQDIVKALSVYRRCPAPVLEAESLHSMSSLKEEVTRAIDAEIRNLVSDDEVQEEAYIKLEQEQWEKFYSCCHQYKQVGEKAKGLFADPVTGLFGIIKKSTFSLLRPCDKTEELYLSPSLCLSVSDIDRYGLGSDAVSASQFSEDVRLLCDCVQLIAAQVPPELDLPSVFISGIQNGQSENLLQQLNEMMGGAVLMDQSLISTLTSKLSCMASPVTAVEMLFNLLEVIDDPDMDLSDSADEEGHRQHYSHLFSGSLGVTVLTMSFQQLAHLRFQFVRDLTMLVSIVSNLQEESGLTQGIRDTMITELLPKGVYLIRCYQLLLWAGDALGVENANNTLDNNLRQLASLEIIDSSSSRNMSRPSSQVTYLIQAFIEGLGGDECRQRMAMTSLAGRALWRDDLALFLDTLCHVIWPAAETVYPEFLVRACQYLRLQEYVHILSPWCTWNESSRAFFLGLSHLHFDETHKAVSLLVEAGDGLATETFLTNLLLQTEETDHYKLQILYYLKIIKLLEEKGLSDLVITMATEAINKADVDDPNLPTLQSKVFKEHLKLGHCEASFAAMMNNPDLERKKDCLRQFLVVLCESGHLGELVAFDYQELEPEVVCILENRARSVDLFTHDYYSLLYSYFVYREDFRAAGRVMLEKAVRLSQEVPGVKSLQEQAQCYLAAFNTLHLVRPESAWIVRPAQTLSQATQALKLSSKRDSDGETKSQHTGCRKTHIVELADLKKEYLLVDARLRLIRHQPDTALVSGPMPSPEEILTLLCSAGLYDLAMSVIKMFSLSPEPLLTSLALRCVTFSLSANTFSKLTVKDNDPSASSWRWLHENQIPPCGASESNPSDQSWSLLQHYLRLLEDGSTSCHKCVAQTLLSQSFHLPTWLIHSYKSLDVASLLRVYLNFDLINLAASLVVEYIEAVTDVLTGIDTPAFNLKGLRSPGCSKVWLPYTCIDQLLAVLSVEDNPTYISMYQTVKEKLKVYQEKSCSVHQEITAY